MNANAGTNLKANASRRYHIWTMGCQMNEADSRKLAAELEQFGYQPVGEVKEADLVVLNTCVVRQQAENKIYGRLGSLKPLKERNPDMVVGVMGCLVGVREAPKLRAKYPFVDVFMSPSDTQPIVDHLSALEAQRREREEWVQIMDENQVLPAAARGKTVTANVGVVLGCSYACTYCIIPSRRGRERSRPVADIITEVTALAAQGVKEIVLLGQIVDRYGLDFDEPSDLADLLANVNEIPGLERIRVLTSHPNYMTDKLIEAIATLDKVCPHIELPVQAGSDEQLVAMRRGYTVEQFRELVGRIRARIPHAAINTDIIVGFCGETEEQFMKTYEAVREIQFDTVHIAKYSTRPGTYAANKMVDDVAPEEKERRRKMLDDLQKEILEEKSQALLDQVVEVLVEDRQKGRWRGRTPQNRLVFFDDERDLRGQLMNIKVEIANPFTLIGSVVE